MNWQERLRKDRKFCVGDRVRLIREIDYNLPHGIEGLITPEYHGTPGWLIVEIQHRGTTYSKGMMEKDNRWKLIR